MEDLVLSKVGVLIFEVVFWFRIWVIVCTSYIYIYICIWIGIFIKEEKVVIKRNWLLKLILIFKDK